MKTMTATMLMQSVEAQASTLECFTAAVAHSPLPSHSAERLKREKLSTRGRGGQHERSSPKVAGPHVIPLLHPSADLEALQLSVSTSGFHLLGGLDEHRRRDFYRSVVSALFPVMEFLVQMIRLLFKRVVN